MKDQTSDEPVRKCPPIAVIGYVVGMIVLWRLMYLLFNWLFPFINEWDALIRIIAAIVLLGLVVKSLFGIVKGK